MFFNSFRHLLQCFVTSYYPAWHLNPVKAVIPACR